MANKICLITGATSGIGKAAAEILARRGFDTILVGRNNDAGKRISKKIESKNPAVRSTFYRCDISELSSVKSLVADIKNNYDHLDVLINNAGARFNEFHKTSDGVELTFATNHLGHFFLTISLIPFLEKSSMARIINVSSSAHHNQDPAFDYLFEKEKYDRRKAYGKSKLANVLFTYELAKRLKNKSITVNTLDPGGVATNLGRNNGLAAWFKHYAYYISKRELISSKKGAETIVFLATDSTISEVSGKYFYKKEAISSSKSSYDKDAAEQLWNLSTKLCGIEDSSL